MIKVAPSILSADFNNLENEIREVVQAGGDYIHIDVMDGKFVENVTEGIKMFKTARSVTEKTIDVHLMVENPQDYIDDFEKADIITFHIETVDENTAWELIKNIKSKNIKVGISIKPNTKLDRIIKFLEHINQVLIMTVEPGKGGQELIPDTINKIKELRKINSLIDIEVDGGINLDTAKIVKEAGANILVAGTAIFKADNKNKIIEELKK
jgi:ribulose-phosphate 3-epimerase